MKNIVVTGANGTIGSRVVEDLVKRGKRVVAMVRDAEKGKPLEALGAGIALGSFEDAASLERTFAEADTVVLITAANARAAEQTIAAIDAAKKAGVRKIVRISALKAALDGPTDNTRQHGRTEKALRDSGLAYVILRPHFFMQNLFGSLGTATGQGKLFAGTGEGRLGMVDTRDVADAAAAAATTDAFDGGTYELTGPASIDYASVAAAIGRGLGREVTFVPITPDAVAETMRGFGLDDWTVGIIRDYTAAYATGFGDFTTDAVSKITGHAPRSIDDFVREMLAPAARASAA
jgi:uncharacterized protein YbjT (DUF2867 family)